MQPLANLEEEVKDMTDNDAPNWPQRRPGEPLYVCKVNPHDRLTPDRESEPVIWECGLCHMKGILDELVVIPCPVIRPPCPHCGLTPICAWDCKGIWDLLRDPKVYLAGGHG